uniref:Cytochrome P450 monooxygenase n=1 Tax=Tribolium castaneum TaxID=7070 RepID=Q7YXL1_TRICA|nr:cytochrome P450 monooxygenase [Tribolium castaneum]
MLVLTTVLTAAAVFLLFYLFYCYKTIKQHIYSLISLSYLPGPPVNDIISGNIPPLYTSAENIFKQLREWGRLYYPIYKLNAAHLAAANILSPEDCELVLSNPTHMEKSAIYNLLHDWLGTGLLTSTGLKWQTRRKILTPAFHFSILQQFVAIFNEETDKLVEVLKEECYKPFVNVNAHVAQFTLKTIAETAMGTKLRFTTRKETIYKQSIVDMGEFLLYRLLRCWLISKCIYVFNPRYYLEKKVTRRLHRFTKSVIAERQENFKEIVVPETDEVYTGKRRLAMLDLLLTAKNKEGLIDDEGIREEVDTFMFEGHDTTAAALGFALMVLAGHKEVQDKIVEEMNEVLGDIKKKPTYQDLQEMKYLERCVKEVLRLYPSVHFISRKLGEDLVTHSGHKLAKASIVNLHIYDLHHNPAIYPDPEKFDPDRFLPENCQKRHPFAYLPFSAGPRNCIGKKFAMLELKAAICGILANFTLEPIDIPETIVLVVDIVLRTKEGIKVRFIPRV